MRVKPLEECMFGKIGPLEIILILVVLFLLFGAKKLPEVAKSIKKAVGEFKKGQEEETPEKKTEEIASNTSAQSTSSANEKKS